MKMLDSTDQASGDASPTLPLLLTVVTVVGLVALLVSTARIEEDGPIGFLVPYKSYLSIGFVVVLGLSAVQTGTKWVFRRRSKAHLIGCRRSSTDYRALSWIWADILLRGLRFD